MPIYPEMLKLYTGSDTSTLYKMEGKGAETVL